MFINFTISRNIDGVVEPLLINYILDPVDIKSYLLDGKPNKSYDKIKDYMNNVFIPILYKKVKKEMELYIFKIT